MKIALLTTNNSHKAGGLYNSVRCLGLALYHKGIDIKHFSFDDEFSEEDSYAYEDLPMVKYKVNLMPIIGPLAYSPNLSKLLSVHKPNIVHSQGIWMYSSYAASSYKRKYGAKTIITPRGMLDPWAVKNNKWKKQLAGILFENKNLHYADCIHALNYSEYESIRKYGLKNPVAIIPNGITLHDEVVYDRGKEKKVLLFVGRIHPKKGISEMLDGVRILKNNSPELLDSWKIRIAGWDQLGHTEELKNKCKELGLDDCIEFIGPVLGEVKVKEHIKADAFILPSFSEGLPMSVLEAWSYELPVIMTDECNLPDGFDNNAAVRVTTNPTSIADGLEKIFRRSDEERIQMGMNGLKLVRKNYTWDCIADKTIRLYKWLLEGGEKPSFVHLD